MNRRDKAKVIFTGDKQMVVVERKFPFTLRTTIFTLSERAKDKYLRELAKQSGETK